MTVAAVDRAALEQKVKSMYSDVAANPHGDFHFEIGRTMRVVDLGSGSGMDSFIAALRVAKRAASSASI
jgi:predicted nicotinamide N-methyase